MNYNRNETPIAAKICSESSHLSSLRQESGHLIEEIEAFEIAQINDVGQLFILLNTASQ